MKLNYDERSRHTYNNHNARYHSLPQSSIRKPVNKLTVAQLAPNHKINHFMQVDNTGTKN